MTRVDFYVLPEADDESRWRFTCRLADKAWRQGNRLLIHTPDEAISHQLDALLWAYPADSFLPHEISPAISHHSPIHIGHGEYHGNHHDMLINLGESIPVFFSRFGRVAEIVTQQAAQLDASRERYRFYRERGYEIQTHDMRRK